MKTVVITAERISVGQRTVRRPTVNVVVMRVLRWATGVSRGHGEPPVGNSGVVRRSRSPDQ
jgi:hypothetical protein